MKARAVPGASFSGECVHPPTWPHLVYVFMPHGEGEGEAQGQLLVLHLMLVQEVGDALRDVVEELEDTPKLPVGHSAPLWVPGEHGLQACPWLPCPECCCRWDSVTLGLVWSPAQLCAVSLSLSLDPVTSAVDFGQRHGCGHHSDFCLYHPECPSRPPGVLAAPSPALLRTNPYPASVGPTTELGIAECPAGCWVPMRHPHHPRCLDSRPVRRHAGVWRGPGCHWTPALKPWPPGDGLCLHPPPRRAPCNSIPSPEPSPRAG